MCAEAKGKKNADEDDDAKDEMSEDEDEAEASLRTKRSSHPRTSSWSDSSSLRGPKESSLRTRWWSGCTTYCVQGGDSALLRVARRPRATSTDPTPLSSPMTVCL